MSKLHHQGPPWDRHRRSACFFTGRAVLWDQAAVTPSLWCATSQFHCWRKATEGALPTRPPIAHGQAESALVSQVALYLDKGLLSARSGRAHMPVASTELTEEKACAGRWPGTETVQTSLPTWCFQTNSACSSQYKRVLHQKEVCADLIRSLTYVTY